MPKGIPSRTSNIMANAMISTLVIAHLQSSHAIEKWISGISLSLRNFPEFSDHFLASKILEYKGFKKVA